MKLVLAAVAALLLAQDSDTERIGKLIQDLDSDSLIVREEATEKLIQEGAAALPLLREALDSESQEVKTRAGRAIQAIEDAEKVGKVYPIPKPLALKTEGPFSELVEKLEKETGLTFKIEGLDASRTVKIDVEEGTLFRVLDAACAQLGDAVWTSGESGEVRIAKGDFVAKPSDYVEHFLFSISRIETTRTTDFKEESGTVMFQVDVLKDGRVDTSFKPNLEIRKIVDQSGAELDDTVTDMAMRQKWAVVQQLAVQGNIAPAGEGQSFFFKGLDKDARKLRTIQGTARYYFPLSSSILEMKGLAQGSSRNEGPYTLTVTRISRNYINLTITSSGPAIDLSKVVDMDSLEVYDTEGTLLPTQKQARGMVATMQDQLAVNVKSHNFFILVQNQSRNNPDRLKVKLIRQFHVREIPFEFRDVPLP